MTIYVRVELDNVEGEWYYSYDADLDLLTARRANAHFPTTTLAGTYDLIMKVDANQIISTLIATMGAAPKFWQLFPSLEVPIAQSGQVYLRNDIDDGQVQLYFTNLDYTIFYVCIGESGNTFDTLHILISQQIILDVTKTGMLAGVWMLDLPPEIVEKHLMKR